MDNENEIVNEMTDEALHAWTEQSARVGSRVMQLLYGQPRPARVVVTLVDDPKDGSVIHFERVVPEEG